jgi:hypothetical protein
MDGGDHVQGAAMAFGGHVHGEIGGGQVLRVALMGAPLHKEAVGQAPEQAQHRHAVGVSDAAAVVVVRNIQSLVKAVFNAAKAGAVEGLNNKIRVVTRRSYGFRTYDAMEIALYHTLGKLPEPDEFTHRFC